MNKEKRREGERRTKKQGETGTEVGERERERKRERDFNWNYHCEAVSLPDTKCYQIQSHVPGMGYLPLRC